MRCNLQLCLCDVSPGCLCTLARHASFAMEEGLDVLLIVCVHMHNDVVFCRTWMVWLDVRVYGTACVQIYVHVQPYMSV